MLDAYVGVPLHNACATTSGKIKPIMRARSLTKESYT